MQTRSELLLILHDKDSTTGTTLEWCKRRNVLYRIVLASHLESIDPGSDFRGMIIFGGDMEAWNTIRYPWLRTEKRFIKASLQHGKRIFGLCLGAQLLAEQLGSKISRMNEWELGWFPVEHEGRRGTFTPLHWHSSTFQLPPKTKRIAATDFCRNQGFKFGQKVIGFQFHAEIDQRRLNHALKGWRKTMKGRVQTPQEIRARAVKTLKPLKLWYHAQLDAWWESSPDGRVK